MGVRGPVPKRSGQRRRRNKTAPVTKAKASSGQSGRKLTGRHSAIARRFWDALGRSGQAEFYEESDWAAAELTVLAIDIFVKKPSAVMLASINSMMASLLVTEGDRRRMRLELEREPEPEEDQGSEVARLDAYRKRAGG